jgi:hypothetical protein
MRLIISAVVAPAISLMVAFRLAMDWNARHCEGSVDETVNEDVTTPVCSRRQAQLQISRNELNWSSKHCNNLECG